MCKKWGENRLPFFLAFFLFERIKGDQREEKTCRILFLFWKSSLKPSRGTTEQKLCRILFFSLWNHQGEPKRRKRLCRILYFSFLFETIKGDHRAKRLCRILVNFSLKPSRGTTEQKTLQNFDIFSLKPSRVTKKKRLCQILFLSFLFGTIEGNQRSKRLFY